MVAIPNYARMNRIGQVATDNQASQEPAVNYAPGATVSATTNTLAAPAPQPNQRRGFANGPQSVVWIKD